MLIQEFISTLEEVIPLGSVGYDRDAVGVQVGFPKGAELTRALFAFEITDEIVDEALSLGVNLIVAFHPLIFPNLTRVDDSTRTGALIGRLVRSNIALYIQHTAFDAHPEFGTSRLMAEALGLEQIKPIAGLAGTMNKIVVYVPQESVEAVRSAMSEAGAGRIGNYSKCSFEIEGKGTFKGDSGAHPTVGQAGSFERVSEVRLEMSCEMWNLNPVLRAMTSAHPYEEIAFDVLQIASGSPNFGMGAVGEWEEGKSIEDVLALTKATFGTAVLRHNEVRTKQLTKIAMLGGAGMDFYSGAVRSGAQAFITADVRYHDFHRARFDDILLIDAGHAETERFVAGGMLRAAKFAIGCAAKKGKDFSKENLEALLVVSKYQPNALRYY
jgi:dinuclear metal center YbgI/SA1388 family protein